MAKTPTSRCMVCQSETPASLIFTSKQYAMTGLFFDKPVESGANIPINLFSCPNCSFTRLIAEAKTNKNYETVNRDTAGQMPHYIDQILSLLKNYDLKQSSTLLEVGSNDGSFLNYLSTEGMRNMIGVEPSSALSKICLSRGHKTFTNFFGKNFVESNKQEIGNCDFVICRHTLEHVPDPLEIVQSAHAILKTGGKIFVEVPDAEFMFENAFGHEVWDEHLNYFTQNNLCQLLQDNFFEIEFIDSWDFRGTKNIVVLASVRKLHQKFKLKKFDNNDILQRLFTFQERWRLVASRCRENINSSPSPVFSIGASHPQINFLNFSGISNLVDYMIDDDLRKKDKFAILEKPLPIISTEDFISNFANGTVILSAFNQVDWQKNIMQQVSSKAFKFVSVY